MEENIICESTCILIPHLGILLNLCSRALIMCLHVHVVHVEHKNDKIEEYIGNYC